MINQRMGTTDWAMLLLLSFLWGGSFFLIGVLVAELPPLTIVTIRVGVAALTLWAVLLVGGYDIPKTFKLWRAFFMLGLLNNVIPFTFIVWGQNHIGAGLASIMNATTPLFTILIAGAFLVDEHITPQKVAGVVLGLIGVSVLIGAESLAGIGLDISLQTLAQLAIMGAAISYGCASVFGRRFKALGVSPFSTSVGQVTASTLILLPITFVIERPDQLANPSLQAWLSILCLGVFCTALGYTLFFKILSSSGATNVVLVTFLVPVTASFLGWLILNEQLHSSHFIGMAFIGLGLAAIDGRVLKKLKAIAS
ncbi:DMT family transporter [Pseudomonadales bacterium]|nr:DMT family transporter [Pseudomonadales bacterium]MDB4151486.1 DMT family transporter [Pseudomonadales bacterium]MDB9866243.1 DMT family transporter [Pseudomonadales bacterium]MDB9917129.1 DMT family transporter [Pseudomonadales bacterium]MDC1306526.1 DMT family transporter [Pseudomonadales bacterium]